MQDIDKSKEQLATEVVQLRRRIAELEAAEIERKQVEEALRKSEEKYRTVVEISPDGIAIAAKGCHVFANESLAKMFGVSNPSELLGKPVMNYIHPDYRKIVKERIEKQTKRGVLAPLIEEKMIGADGTVIDTEVAAAPLEYEGEQAVLAVIRDITERKQTEAALRESETRYRSLFENSQDAILLTSPDGSIFDVNPAACQMFGRTAEEIKQIGRVGLVDVTDMRFDAALEERTRLGKTRAEITMIRADGTRFPVDLTSTIFIDEQGQTRTSMIIRDISERKQVEEALHESEERYRILIDNIALGINLIDADHNILMVNASMVEKFNKPISEMIGKKCFRELEKRDAVCPYCPGVRTMATGRPAEVETEGVRDDGSRFHVRLQTFPVVGQDGRTTAFIEIGEDITERKRIEEALRESEKEIRMIAENVPALFSYIDRDGRYRFINKRYEEWFGIPQKEIIGRHYREVLGEATYELIKGRVETTLSGQRVYYEEVLPYARGGLRWVAAVYVPDVNDRQEVKGFFALVTDITERKRMEEALRESEGKYRSLVESSEDSIYLVDKDSTYLFMNKKHLSRLGVQSNQVIGRPYSEFHSPEETKDFAQKVEKVLKTGKSLSYEYRSQRDNRYFIRTVNPVKISKGDKPSAITVISKDITELKQTEDTLREREAFNFALFQYNPVETIVVDLEGRVTGFNLAKEKSGDRSPAIGDAMYKDYAGKHEIDMRAELMKCIKLGKAKEFPERKYSDKYLSITVSPFSQGALIISEDTTERKHAEELLQKERDTFFSILQKAPYGVVFLDKDGKGIFTNNEFTTITGYTLDDVSSLKDWFRLAYPDKKYRDMVINIMGKDVVQENGDKIFQKTFHRAFFRTFQVTCKDGTIKEIEFRPTVLEDGGTIVMIADITERKRMHELLEVAVTEWRTTFDAISDAVCLLDEKGRIKRCNNAMTKMIGKPFSAISDRACWEVLHGVSKPPKRCAIAGVQETRHRETEVVSRDSLLFNISVDPLLDEGGNFLGGVHIMSDITKRMQAEKELKSSHEQLRDLTVYLQSVREEERTNIAREIHDELAQALTALKMDLSWLDNKLPRDQMPLIAKTRSMNELIDTTIRTVKRISAELRPGMLDDLGLVAAIEWQAEEFQDRTGINCHITVDPEDLALDQDHATAIFRIFQETLTNIARYARATMVTVNLKKKAGTLTLQVMDNGIGITEEQIRDSKSFGLIGMRERVHPWEGTVSIKGTPGEGTTVEVKVSVAKN
jgi:PAS domain S-box-containing protein